MKNYLLRIKARMEDKILAAKEFIKDKDGSIMEWIMTNKIVALGAVAVLGLFIAAIKTAVNAMITVVNGL